MEDLAAERRFRIDRETFQAVRAHLAADSVDNETCLETIRDAYERHGYLMDPHTAVAYKAACNLRTDDVPVIIASTAHWAKFGDNVYRALHGIRSTDPLPADVAALTGCELNSLISSETGGSDVPTGLAELDELPIRFTEVIEGSAACIETAIVDYLSGR